jgi:Holliday junction resolvase
MESGDSGNVGERIIEAVLKTDGWTCKRNTQLPGSTDIEARKGARAILVQVKTATSPNTPAGLSGEEMRNITARASRLGCEAWLVKVQITRLGRPVGGVHWIHLG